MDRINLVKNMREILNILTEGFVFTKVDNEGQTIPIICNPTPMQLATVIKKSPLDECRCWVELSSKLRFFVWDAELLHDDAMLSIFLASPEGKDYTEDQFYPIKNNKILWDKIWTMAHHGILGIMHFDVDDHNKYVFELSSQSRSSNLENQLLSNKAFVAATKNNIKIKSQVIKPLLPRGIT
jgi:hypothetical protein